MNEEIPEQLEERIQLWIDIGKAINIPDELMPEYEPIPKSRDPMQDIDYWQLLPQVFGDDPKLGPEFSHSRATPGGVYLHNKSGNLYFVLAISADVDSHVERVVYYGLDAEGKINHKVAHDRLRSEFEERIILEGEEVPRFEYQGRHEELFELDNCWDDY